MSGRYVVHQHAARRMHWDLRLQVGHVLYSFAVPKGPSLDPKVRRLAVHTEDHPLEYLDFEDVIPAGNYGAGAMIVWDLGRVSYLETTAEAGIQRGKIDFTLSGFKLNGRFALVHTGRRRTGGDELNGNEWLLIKKSDAHARAENNLVETMPESVLSGLTVSELPKREALRAGLEERARAAGGARHDFRAEELTPMLCATGTTELDDPDRLYELKLDGVRIVADKRGDRVALRYRTKRPAAASYPEITRALRSLVSERLVLDGEIVAFDESGKPSFERLAPRIHANRPQDVAAQAVRVPVVYLVFDVLQIGPYCLWDVPLERRKTLLASLVPKVGLIRVLDHIRGRGSALLDLCRSESIEGIVAKRANSPYRPGPMRSTDWIKIKRERDDDFVVVGWMPRKGTTEELGALCLGSYVARQLGESGEQRALRYRGRVGSGLDRETLHMLTAQLKALSIAPYHLEGATADDTKKMIFVKPNLVVRARFSGWTEEGRLRGPVFAGLRTDKEPDDCTAAPPRELETSASLMLDEEPTNTESSALDGPSQKAGTPASSGRVTISNREKLFWPDEGYTKGDLCDYYASVGHVMLPFLKGRPVVLVRYPDGIWGKSFYQWRIPPKTPSWIRTLELYDEEKRAERGSSKNVFLIDDVDSLLYIANLGCIPLHALAYREGSPKECEFLTIDLDVGDRPIADAVRLALTLRRILDGLNLAGFAKTSGQKGLHVLVPLGPHVDFPTAKLLCELLGQLVVQRHPDLATMQRVRSKRGDRVYVDTGQTGTSRTIVAPYSARAFPGATVSTPLGWDEVHLALDPSAFTILSVPERVECHGDPMATLLDQKPGILAAVETLGQWLDSPGMAP